MTTAMERIARRETARATLPEMLSYLEGLLGQQLTTVIAGERDARLIEAWARAQVEPSSAAGRSIRAAYETARLLMQAESAGTVRTWFMGMNPLLDDRSPALVIRTEPGAVLHAARAPRALG